jgi:hypothetical protein
VAGLLVGEGRPEELEALSPARFSEAASGPTPPGPAFRPTRVTGVRR